MAIVDGHGEGGAERGVVRGDHRLQVELAGEIARDRRADDAGGVADDEGELLGGGVDGGDDQVALVLAIVVVGDHDDLAAFEGAQRGCDTGLVHHRLLMGLGAWGEAEKIVGGDRAAGGGGDLLGGLARDPHRGIVAQRRDRRRRQADAAREGAAGLFRSGEPLVEAHEH